MDDTHKDAVLVASKPKLYICIPQIARDNPLYRPLLSRYMELAARTGIRPDAMIAELRRKIAETNPHLAFGDFSTMGTTAEDSIGAQKLAECVVSLPPVVARLQLAHSAWRFVDRIGAELCAMVRLR